MKTFKHILHVWYCRKHKVGDTDLNGVLLGIYRTKKALLKAHPDAVQFVEFTVGRYIERGVK